MDDAADYLELGIEYPCMPLLALAAFDGSRPNAVTTEYSGYVMEARVEDGDTMEYGHELFVLTPEPPGRPNGLS